MRTPEELTGLLRARGRKATAQRQCIFRVLQGDESHPTAEDIHESARRQMETISLKTVYQTLNDLAALGEIDALDLGTGTTRFDPNVETAHHHLVCRDCGKVRDLHVEFPGLVVPPGAEDGFEVAGAEVVFRGSCAQCRRRHRRPSPRTPARAASATSSNAPLTKASNAPLTKAPNTSLNKSSDAPPNKERHRG